MLLLLTLAPGARALTLPALPPCTPTPPALPQYRNEELMRVVEAAPGAEYVLEFCVATTATYGDKFRPVGGRAGGGGCGVCG